MASTRRSKQDNRQDKAKKESLREQLDKAEKAALKARDTAAQLHAWWRAHLFRLSLLVLLLSFHQAQQPSTECIKNIKSINQEIAQYSGSEAFYIVVNDCVTEVMGLIMMASLVYFLYKTDGRKFFSDKSYMLATMLVPLQVSSFFQNRTMGCGDRLGGGQPPLPLDRPFPVSVIFHTIATLCCWFMEHQMRGRHLDVRKVNELRKTLEEAEQQAEKKSNKKK